MTLEAELAHVLLAIKEADASTRYGLILKALALANMCGYQAGIQVDAREPQWPLAVIELPNGQVSFALPQHVRAFDGHTTEDKYRRIAEFMKSV